MDRVVGQRLILLALLVAVALWITVRGRHRGETGDRRRTRTAFGHGDIGHNRFVLNRSLRLGGRRDGGRLRIEDTPQPATANSTPTATGRRKGRERDMGLTSG